MARLSTRDRQELDGIARDLMDDDGTRLEDELERVRLLLRAERFLVYRPRWRPGGYAVDFALSSGFSSADRLGRRLARTLGRTDRPWALFNPLAPEPPQRNRAVNLPAPDHWRTHAGSSTLSRLGYDAAARARLCRRMERLNGPLRALELADQHVCRVLLCDGARLRAFVGAFRGEPFSERERQLLAGLSAALGAALAAMHARRAALSNADTIDGLLAILTQPALVIDGDGAIAHANQPGWLRAAHDPSLASGLAALARGEARPGLVSQPLPSGAGVERRLVTVTDDRGTHEQRLRASAHRWRLTPRESEALAGVAEGASTKQLAAQLGCSTRVVEHHLTRLFRKAGVDGRATLVARLLADALTD
jgi:DNA-binding CsgD family transcriptional regulator